MRPSIPDSDGVTNREEFPAGTHPRGLFKYYLAEGAQNGFFNTEIAVFKPATTADDGGSIVAQFLGQNGRRTASPILNLFTGPTRGDLFIFSEASLGLETFPLPDQAFSTLVESEQPLAVERTLTWGGGMGAGYGSHAERAISGPASTWYFAEGATHGAFDLFYLLQNPGATAATATITYLLPAPRAPIVRAYTLLPNSRRTIYVDEEPGLGGHRPLGPDRRRPADLRRAGDVHVDGRPAVRRRHRQRRHHRAGAPVVHRRRRDRRLLRSVHPDRQSVGHRCGGHGHLSAAGRDDGREGRTRWPRRAG